MLSFGQMVAALDKGMRLHAVFKVGLSCMLHRSTGRTPERELVLFAACLVSEAPEDGEWQGKQPVIDIYLRKDEETRDALDFLCPVCHLGLHAAATSEFDYEDGNRLVKPIRDIEDMVREDATYGGGPVQQSAWRGLCPERLGDAWVECEEGGYVCLPKMSQAELKQLMRVHAAHVDQFNTWAAQETREFPDDERAAAFVDERRRAAALWAVIDRQAEWFEDEGVEEETGAEDEDDEEVEEEVEKEKEAQPAFVDKGKEKVDDGDLEPAAAVDDGAAERPVPVEPAPAHASPPAPPGSETSSHSDGIFLPSDTEDMAVDPDEAQVDEDDAPADDGMVEADREVKTEPGVATTTTAAVEDGSDPEVISIGDDSSENEQEASEKEQEATFDIGAVTEADVEQQRAMFAELARSKNAAPSDSSSYDGAGASDDSDVYQPERKRFRASSDSDVSIETEAVSTRGRRASGVAKGKGRARVDTAGPSLSDGGKGKGTSQPRSKGKSKGKGRPRGKGKGKGRPRAKGKAIDQPQVARRTGVDLSEEDIRKRKEKARVAVSRNETADRAKRMKEIASLLSGKASSEDSKDTFKKAEKYLL